MKSPWLVAVSKIGWLTPLTMPGSYRCRVLHLPEGEMWAALFAGALLMLADSGNYEASEGGISEMEAADVWKEVFYRYDEDCERCVMFAGMVVASAGNVIPNERWLPCDGTERAINDYPALYAAIGSTFGAAGSGNFRLPNLAGRLPLGAGNGAGLTARSVGQSGGEENHQLSVGEMPAHTHTLTGWRPAVAGSGGSAVFPELGSYAGSWVTSSAGSGAAHNNMPPYLVLSFFIYAG